LENNKIELSLEENLAETACFWRGNREDGKEKKKVAKF
jgi:hypothetical protein